MRRTLLFIPLALVSVLAVLAAGAVASTTQASTGLTVVGPWQGADAASFRAVLDNFQQRNPGVQVTYTPVSGSVAASLSSAPSGTTTPDVALLQLPADLSAMRSMARAGMLQPVEFAVPAVRANYAFAWKQHGSVDGRLYGVFFKATNDSAFWFNNRDFQNRGVKTLPSTWSGLQRLSDTLSGSGAKPFALSAESDILLPSLFQNVYLMQQGNQRYDRLGRGEIRWTDGSVRDALSSMRSVVAAPARVAGGLGALENHYAGAVQQVFGTPQRASLVQGGSAVIPVLRTAKAVRPVTQFSTLPFPSLNGIGPARVIGHADAAVMVKDSPAARALIGFLATPASATIWAKRGGDYLSPNRNVSPGAYGVPAMRTLATALTRASVFRFGLADLMSPTMRAALNRALSQYVRNPARVAQITAQLDAAARQT
ncbi:MAG TPA: extracellular solute-binding protein [Gaiellaceae bacterium]|nr:extracellular solute-binding protein [Gaiellaceae bacterium]